MQGRRKVLGALAGSAIALGSGIFMLAWSLIVIPVSLGTLFNYRGMAEGVICAGAAR